MCTIHKSLTDLSITLRSTRIVLHICTFMSIYTILVNIFINEKEIEWKRDFSNHTFDKIMASLSFLQYETVEYCTFNYITSLFVSLKHFLIPDRVV